MMNNLKPQGISSLSLYLFRHSFFALIFFALVAASALYMAKKLTMDADLAALLPDSFQSVEDLELVKQRFGGIGYVVITLQQSTAENMRTFADDIHQRLTPLADVSFVDHRKPVEFFQDRALYFLDVEDLNIIKKRITKRYRWEKKTRNPMYIDLEGSQPPEVTFDDLEDKYAGEGNSDWMSAQKSEEAYYFNADKTLLAIFVKPKMASADLAFSQKIIDDIWEQIHQLDLTKYGENLQVEITGRYQKKIDLQQQMQKDMGVASLVALLLVITYLLFHFRRLEALILILIPLLFGIVCTFGFASLVFGQLNILTAFIGVILMGLGIDHGIHLLSRYQDERKKGLDEQQTVFQTFSSTGVSVAIAALTTFVIFIGLGFSEFRAFHEFGIIAAGGMLFIMAAYLFLLPPLLKLTAKLSWRFQNVDKKDPDLGLPTLSVLTRLHQNWSPTVMWIGLVSMFFVSTNALRINFNYDFESLGNSNLRSFQLDRQVNDLLGYSQTPMVILTDSKAEEAHVSEVLRNNQQKIPSRIDFLLSTADLVPEDQQQKHILIQKIAKVVNRIKPSWLNEEDLQQLEDMKTMVKAQPFSYAELPIEVRQFFGSDQTEQGAVMMFPAISLSDGEKVLELAAEARNVSQSDGKRVPIAGESMILADILALVFTESPKVMLLSLIFILAIVWFFMKKLHLALICLTPALFTITLTLGFMAIANIELNYINMVIIPILLGIGVDSGIHMVSRSMEGDSLGEVIDETGLAIFGSIVTSGLGFGALLLTDHPGLNSLAIVALVGLSINFMVSILFLPALLGLSSFLKNYRLQSTFEKIHILVSTVGFAGYSPKAPGTLGALSALPFCWLMADLNTELKLTIIVLLTLAVWYSTWKYMANENKQHGDPQEIVSDEFVGVLITLSLVPFEWTWVVLGFILFRAFDILKPGPVGYIDRNFKNSFGVLMDDVVAGILAGLLLWGIYTVT